MGLVYADIQLINGDDIVLSRRGLMAAEDQRSIRVRALVDSGAYMMAINETIAGQLDLPAVGSVPAEMADGSIIQLPIVGPLTIRFENRRANVDAIVLPGDATVLLGAIPMEYMDVLIDPRNNRLIVNPEHPLRAQTILK